MGWATRRVVHAFKARGGDLPPMLDQPGRNFCERTCYRYRQPGRNCGRPSAGRRRAGRRRRPRFISRTHWYIRGETALDGGVRCVSVVPGGGRLPGGGEGRGADDRPQVSTTRLRAHAVVFPPVVADQVRPGGAWSGTFPASALVSSGLGVLRRLDGPPGPVPHQP